MLSETQWSGASSPSTEMHTDAKLGFASNGQLAAFTVAVTYFAPGICVTCGETKTNVHCAGLSNGDACATPGWPIIDIIVTIAQPIGSARAMD
jgi:hypothetical protein